MYDFTLYLSDFDVMRNDVLDRLYEAGFDDATFGVRDGVQFASLHRQGPSFEAAVSDATKSLQAELPGLRVVAVEDRG